MQLGFKYINHASIKEFRQEDEEGKSAQGTVAKPCFEV